ncbi:helix-turn-helix domain-containing protein [Amycolatopsis thermoflava]|uniref:helix-turn-helix domain-containing protein n=1 Tax=Amycolatopsis thermoflava TaxID=84480 RepID=UPI00365B82B2
MILAGAIDPNRPAEAGPVGRGAGAAVASSGGGAVPRQSHHRRPLGVCVCREHGPAGLVDRPSRPHHSHGQTPPEVEAQVVALRTEPRVGPLRVATRVPVAASTAYQVLYRHGLPLLAACDWATGEPIRRCQRDCPGELGRPASRANQVRARGGTYVFLHPALSPNGAEGKQSGARRHCPENGARRRKQWNPEIVEW